MWWHGHNDALAGDPPNESYYHYYYDYKLAYDQVRRDQRRNQRQQLVNRTAQRMLLIGPIVLLLGLLAYAAWTQYQPDPLVAGQVQVVPTATPRPTPRPTLPAPTPTPEPSLHIDGLAIITGTEGAALRARARPGTGSDVPIQTRFREGQTVRILEGPQSADDLEWWRVEADGESGWAAAPYLKPAEPTTTP
jgi:hypothetical protein